ncbi:MAG TPA: HlyD family secretion protein [Terriglobales bacterium]|nr:HlyD family secretion protein [Terriglobales bacterium]
MATREIETPAQHPPAPLEPPPRSQPRALLAAAAAAIVVIAVGLYFYYRHRVSTDDAQVEAHLDPIAPRVAGTVQEVDVLENQTVAAGQVLFRLDPSDYQLALRHAEADLAAARAAAQAATSGVPITRTSTSSQVSSAEAALAQARADYSAAEQQQALAEARQAAAQANLIQAQANAQRAASDEKRYAQLIAKDEVSEEQYDAIRTAATAAAAQARAAAADLNAARNAVAAAAAGVAAQQGRVEQALAGVRAAASAPEQVRVSRANAAQAESRVALAEAAVAQAQLNLDWTTVRAPVAGIVGDKHVEVGQNFVPGQAALVIVESGKPLLDRWVIANFKETQLEGMHPGQRAQVHVDAFGEDLAAHVDSIGAATGSRFSLLPPENATGNYVKVVQRVPVKLYFQPGQDRRIAPLRPGMSVEVTVFTK